eukprot:TRINITY_DN2862_c0_g1_i3.p1 TRINITY_DN2862_c0_g1~~TRINITY_DN2862_c0_g1_i3.p1  ORF type:complete len:504 (+),score=120.92 TRINITY_DN2862_c0_g1_i3:866-2377(+)
MSTIDNEFANLEDFHRRNDFGSVIVNNVASSFSTKIVLETVLRLVSTSYGPDGRLKLVDGGGGVTLTTLSERLAGALAVEHPAARLVLQLQEGVADGGLLAMALCCRLVLSGMALGGDGGRHTVAAGYMHALACVEEYVGRRQCPLRVPLSWARLPPLLSLVRSVLGTKSVCRWCTGTPTAPGAPSGLEQISVRLLEAFLAGLELPSPPGPPADDDGAPRVRFLGTVGDRLAGSCFHGVVLDLPLPFGCAKRVAAVSVALFDVSLLTVSESEAASELPSVSATTAEAVRTAAASERQRLMVDVGRRLVSLGVGLVACQKRIDPTLMAMLAQAGVVCLERLSNRHVDAVRRLCGGVLVRSWRQLLDDGGAALFGRLAAVEERTIDGLKYASHPFRWPAAGAAPLHHSCRDKSVHLIGLSSLSGLSVCPSGRSYPSFRLVYASVRLVYLSVRPIRLSGVCLSVRPTHPGGPGSTLSCRRTFSGLAVLRPTRMCVCMCSYMCVHAV